MLAIVLRESSKVIEAPVYGDPRNGILTVTGIQQIASCPTKANNSQVGQGSDTVYLNKAVLKSTSTDIEGKTDIHHRQWFSLGSINEFPRRTGNTVSRAHSQAWFGELLRLFCQRCQRTIKGKPVEIIRSQCGQGRLIATDQHVDKIGKSMAMRCLYPNLLCDFVT